MNNLKLLVIFFIQNCFLNYRVIFYQRRDTLLDNELEADLWLIPPRLWKHPREHILLSPCLRWDHPTTAESWRPIFLPNATFFQCLSVSIRDSNTTTTKPHPEHHTYITYTTITYTTITYTSITNTSIIHTHDLHIYNLHFFKRWISAKKMLVVIRKLIVKSIKFYGKRLTLFWRLFRAARFFSSILFFSRMVFESFT